MLGVQPFEQGLIIFSNPKLSWEVCLRGLVSLRNGLVKGCSSFLLLGNDLSCSHHSFTAGALILCSITPLFLVTFDTI